MEQCSAQLQPGAQFQSIAEISVVGQGHFALHVIDDNGLGIGTVGAAGGSVAYMTNGNCPLGILSQGFPVKDIGKKPQVPVDGKYAVIVHDNAAAFLPPVLQSKQPIVAKICQGLYGRRENAKYAAFFMKLCHKCLLFFLGAYTKKCLDRQRVFSNIHELKKSKKSRSRQEIGNS